MTKAEFGCITLKRVARRETAGFIGPRPQAVSGVLLAVSALFRQFRFSGKIRGKRRESPLPTTVPLYLGSTILTVPAKPNHQIGDHDEIKQQHDQFRRTDSFGEFINFKRDKGRSCDDREELSPTFA
jgi:hypothetical protein